MQNLYSGAFYFDYSENRDVPTRCSIYLDMYCIDSIQQVGKHTLNTGYQNCKMEHAFDSVLCQSFVPLIILNNVVMQSFVSE